MARLVSIEIDGIVDRKRSETPALAVSAVDGTEDRRLVEEGLERRLVSRNSR